MRLACPSPSERQHPAGGILFLRQQGGWSRILVPSFGALMKIAAVVAALTACSLPAGPVQSSEQDAVAMNNASIVLLRMATNPN